jgi:hypothetical protein
VSNCYQCPVHLRSSVPHMCLRYSKFTVHPRSYCVTPMCQSYCQCPVHPRSRSKVPMPCLSQVQCTSHVSEVLPMPCSSLVLLRNSCGYVRVTTSAMFIPGPVPMSQCPVCPRSSVYHMCLRYSQCPVCPRSCCITPMCQSFYQCPVCPRSSPNPLFIPGAVPMPWSSQVQSHHPVHLRLSPNALFVPGPFA